MPETVNQKFTFVPQFFIASTANIAERAIEANILKYPALCFVKDTQQLAWLYEDNSFNYISGDNQIYGVDYDKATGVLSFQDILGNTILSTKIEVAEEQIPIETITEKVRESLPMASSVLPGLVRLDGESLVSENDIVKISKDYISKEMLEYVKNLNAPKVGGEGKLISSIEEVNGIIVAHSVELADILGDLTDISGNKRTVKQYVDDQMNKITNIAPSDVSNLFD